MRNLKKRWSDLIWYEKLAATPGVIIVGCSVVAISPVLLFMYCIIITFELLDFR